jgi:hypothetical protein
MAISLDQVRQIDLIAARCRSCDDFRWNTFGFAKRFVIRRSTPPPELSRRPIFNGCSSLVGEMGH